MKMSKRWVYGMMLLAGLMDATTGALLLAAPWWTLNLMGITVLPLEPLYQRWIGAFVCSVGCAYLIPFLLPAGSARDQRSMGILTMATVVRIFIAGFTGVAIATGALEPAWLSVTFTDATLAILHILALRKKALD